MLTLGPGDAVKLLPGSRMMTTDQNSATANSCNGRNTSRSNFLRSNVFSCMHVGKNLCNYISRLVICMACNVLIFGMQRVEMLTGRVWLGGEREREKEKEREKERRS
jgi:hypothetical protein